MKDRFIFIAAALESIELIQSYIEGYDLTGFLADRKTRLPTESGTKALRINRSP